LGLADEYMAQHAEDILELFDWTGLEVEFYPITLDRLKRLLEDALATTSESDAWEGAPHRAAAGN
jgi:hypothetical protein